MKTRSKRKNSDDFERDLDMDVDECAFKVPVKPTLRKRLSLHKMKQDIEFEQVVYEDNNFMPPEEDFSELRQDDIFHAPLGHLSLRKMNSDFQYFSEDPQPLDCKIEKRDEYFNIDEDKDILDDYNQYEEPTNARKSTRTK